MKILKPRKKILDKDHAIALLTGALCVFGFAPFGIFPIPVLALAVLFLLWQRNSAPSTAASIGFMFGLGLFAAGIGWIYIAMHDYGGMPLVLSLLAALLFAAFWALLSALAGYAQARLTMHQALRYTLVMPVIWVLVEWIRGFIFTGFPWLTLGYAHSDSPLAGYGPLLGVYGVSLAAAVSAGLLALIVEEVRTALDQKQKFSNSVRAEPAEASRISQQGPSTGSGRTVTIFALLMTRRVRVGLLMLAAVWIAGALLRTIAWTQPSGEPFSVALVQGNIPQDLKFREDALVGTLETYRRLVEENDARLTVLPETALPLLRHQVPPYLSERLGDQARKNGGDILIGAFERNNGSYYNGAFTLGSSDEQRYRKQHLVPFGEFIPLRPLLGWFINGVLDIPMGDLARGAAVQAPLEIAGQSVAVDICYEDVFGEEIIRTLPQATLLVNITNDAWYGNSPVAAQHNQISQFRALETGRMMLRATNTGLTSIIGADGQVQQQLPQHEEGVLLGEAQGYEGSTPYVYWGNAAMLLILFAMLAYAWKRRNSSPEAGQAGNPPGGCSHKGRPGGV